MATSKNKCFNYYKMEHFRQDCRISDYKLLKKKALTISNKIAITHLDLNLTINNNKKQLLPPSTPKKMISTLSYSAQKEHL